MILCKGFSLVEMILVVAVLAIVMGLSFPDLKKTHAALELRQAADSVVYALRHARSRALIEGAEMRVVLAEKSFQLEKLVMDEGKGVWEGRPLPGRMGRLMMLPAAVRFRDAPSQVLVHADGLMDQVAFGIEGDAGAFLVSTKERPGHVVLLEER